MKIMSVNTPITEFDSKTCITIDNTRGDDKVYWWLAALCTFDLMEWLKIGIFEGITGEWGSKDVQESSKGGISEMEQELDEEEAENSSSTPTQKENLYSEDSQSFSSQNTIPQKRSAVL